MSDRDSLRETKEELAVYCEGCFGRIDPNRPATQTSEGEWMHIKCAVNSITHACPKCGWMSDGETYGEDELWCENCDTTMKPISKSRARKSISRTTLAKEEPELYA